ncbi:hypothetical protein P5V34_11805 [Mycobacteroides abscessus subsp. abscessus]|nr:hypothetical protein [Mycobacteroides abscessus]MDO3014670.1 hypothetical protein [Mycobacteroides abscessus subsp. abscessus]
MSYAGQAEHQRHRARLETTGAVGQCVAEPLQRDPELEFGLDAAAEIDAVEVEQLAHRPDDRGDVVAAVQLNNCAAGLVSGVANTAAHLDLTIAHGRVEKVHLEGGVAEVCASDKLPLHPGPVPSSMSGQRP